MVGQTISHYNILQKLGQGGMGIIYKAEDVLLKRTVVLKFLPPDLTDDVEARERFIHEAQAASALDNPNICTIYEIGKSEQNQMFISMAYYEGETLKDLISRGPLSVEQAVDIARQIAAGLSAAHEHEIVHRDIKPANMIVTRDGVVKILDFGLAKLKGRTKVTKTGSTLGTLSYMSPEQAKGDEVDTRTDIWSLGVVLYEMLAGRLPFQSDYGDAVLYMIVNEEPKSLSSLCGEAPANLERIVTKCLVKNPERRYQSAKEVLMNLNEKMELRVDLPEELSAEQSGLQQAIVLAVCVIRPGLLITREECARLDDVVKRRMIEGYRLFVLDMNNVYSVNSISFGSLLSLGVTIQMRMGGKLVLAGINRRVQVSMGQMKLKKVFDIYHTVESAVSDLLDVPVDSLPAIEYE